MKKKSFDEKPKKNYNKTYLIDHQSIIRKIQITEAKSLEEK